jgi:hypothetical protein
MHLPPPFVYPQSATEPPALVQAIAREEEVLWNRPTFKAPPLKVPEPTVAPFGPEVRKSDSFSRSR